MLPKLKTTFLTQLKNHVVARSLDPEQLLRIVVINMASFVYIRYKAKAGGMFVKKRRKEKTFALNLVFTV